MRYLQTLFLFIVFFSSLVEAKDKPLKIFVFQSYHETLEWTKQFNAGINEFKKKYGNEKIEFFIESIDYLRLKNQLEPEVWGKYLKEKYKNIKFDGIIIESEFTSKLFSQFSDSFYPNIPKVYLTNIAIKPKNNVYIQSSFTQEFFKKNIDLVFAHNQDIKTIYIIKGKNKTAKKLEKRLVKELQKKAVKIAYFDDFLLDELKIKLQKLPKNSIVFSILNFTDKSGKTYSPEYFLQTIASTSSVPIYNFWSSHIGLGSLGGFMSDGKNAAQIVLKNLIHFIQNGIFLDNLSQGQFWIDYSLLKKYGIDEKLNPKDTIYTNRPIPVWELYPYESLLAIGLIIILAVSLVFTVILKIRNDKIKVIEENMFVRSRQAEMGK